MPVLLPMDELIATYKEALNTRDASSRFCTLITLDELGYPASRVLTIRSIDESGIRLYVNKNSPKVMHLQNDEKFEVLFFWPNLMKQYKVRGDFELFTEADQISQWKHKPYAGRLVDMYHSLGRNQSSKVDSREVIETEIAKLADQYSQELLIQPPEDLVTLLIKPTYISAWVNMQKNRIHNRTEYALTNSQWLAQVLVP